MRFSDEKNQRSKISGLILICELFWAIRLAAATFIAPYCDKIAPYLELTTMRLACNITNVTLRS
jgi:hypothetical protein